MLLDQSIDWIVIAGRVCHTRTQINANYTRQVICYLTLLVSIFSPHGLSAVISACSPLLYSNQPKIPKNSTRSCRNKIMMSPRERSSDCIAPMAAVLHRRISFHQFWILLLLMVMLLAHLQKSHAVTLIVGDNDLTLSEVSIDLSGVRAGRLNIPFRVVEYVVATWLVLGTLKT